METNFVNLTGGENMSWYKVLAQRPGFHKDYRSFKDGVELNWDNPEYWQNKRERTYNAIILTITGNAVRCEKDLKEKGYNAFAMQATEVHVIFEQI